MSALPMLAVMRVNWELMLAYSSDVRQQRTAYTVTPQPEPPSGFWQDVYDCTLAAMAPWHPRH